MEPANRPSVAPCPLLAFGVSIKPLVGINGTRVAIIIADNLKTHTAEGSLLVRGMLTELSDQLYLVSTPAYDPDANRIEWPWRVSRRVVTHNHQCRDFELLLSDVRTHFETLSRSPDDLLRHIGSPFAPDECSTQPQAPAA